MIWSFISTGLGDIYAKYRGEADGGDHERTGFRFVIRGGDELYLELGIFSADPGEIRRSTQM